MAADPFLEAALDDVADGARQRLRRSVGMEPEAHPTYADRSHLWHLRRATLEAAMAAVDRAIVYWRPEYLGRPAVERVEETPPGLLRARNELASIYDNGSGPKGWPDAR